jgi:hypothetical protein
LGFSESVSAVLVRNSWLGKEGPCLGVSLLAYLKIGGLFCECGGWISHDGEETCSKDYL